MIKEPKVIVKKGEKISQGAAEMMNKLDIKPFSVGFVPIASFDIEKGKVYFDINIDKEKVIKDIKEAFSKSLPFAVEIGYTSKDTINFLIGKAGMYEKKLDSIYNKQNSQED